MNVEPTGQLRERKRSKNMRKGKSAKLERKKEHTRDKLL